MKQKFYLSLVLWFTASQLFAQDFTGTVKKNDSLSAPIYQANVDILEGGKPFKTLKTYFNGTYKFTPAKSQTYKIHITYTGYTDTTFEVSTDKNGVLNANNVLVKLKKDGMRLMGIVKSAEEDFPIEGAVVVLKNIMNRLEVRQTTGLDGAYNFKLDYETNYKFSIDKRSPGIINKYKDTTFYFSTVGFNIPLDYKLNVALDPVLYAQTDVREGYDPTKAKNAKTNAVATPIAPSVEKEQAPAVEAKQPFIAAEKAKTVDDKVVQLQAELEKARKEIDALRKREQEAKKSVDFSVNSAPAAKKRKEDKNLEVVVIKDDVVKPVVQNSASIEKDRLAVEAKAKELEVKIADQQKHDLQAAKRAQDLANLQKQQEDSLRIARESNENKKMLAALSVETGKAKEDSIARTKAQALEAKKAMETKAKADSIAEVLVTQRAERVADSLAQIKAKALALEKNKTDSIAKAKAQLALIEKAKADSIVQEKLKGAALEKQKTDSLNKVKAEIVLQQKAKADSLAQVKSQLAAAEKLRVDSLAKVNANLLAARQKQKADSLAIVKAEVAAQEKLKADSIAQAKLQIAAAEKAKKDSINSARIVAAQQKLIADSTAKANAAIAAMKKKQEETTAQLRREIERQDSILHADILRKQAERAEQEKRNRELAEKAKREAIIAEQLRAKQVEDSIAQAKLLIKKQEEQEAILRAKQAEEKRMAEEKQKAEQARLAIAIADSINQAKKQEELAAKAAAEFKKQQAILEQARKKQFEDSIAQAKLFAKQKEEQEAILRAKQAEEKRMAEEKQKAEQARLATAIADSINQAKKQEELAAKAALELKKQQAIKEQARKKQLEDSVAQAKLLAKKNEEQEAILWAKQVEEKRIAEEKYKVEQARFAAAIADSINQAKKQEESAAKVALELKKQQTIQEQVRKKQLEDSVAQDKLLAKQKEEQQTKVQAERIKQETAERKKLEELALSVRKKQMEDSMLLVNDLKQSARLQDSIQREKEELKKLVELVEHTKEKMRKDSVVRQAKLIEAAIVEQARAARQDSINRVKAQLETTLKAQDEFRKIELERSAAVQKLFADSINAINMAQEKLKAELKALQDKQNQTQDVANGSTKKSDSPTAKKPTIATELPIPVPAAKLPSINNNKINSNLPTISFDKNSVEIGAKQKLEFKVLLQLIKDNPTKMVALYAIASADENNPKQISLRRSDSMLRYLMQNGVAIDKIKSTYFGNEKSRNGCVSSMCPEELQNQNRCVVFEMIEPSSD